MFTATSLISYTIFGIIGYRGSWVPSIKGVHISDQLYKDTSQPYDRIIEFTPFAKTELNENVNGGVIKFHFTNELTIKSIHWGENVMKFSCFDKEQIIELFQRK